MASLILHHYYRSSCSWRVRWALLYKKIACDYQHVHLLKQEQKFPAYVEMSATGLVPTLQIGDDFYSDSIAILEWLEENHPNPPLLPVATLERLRVRQICGVIASGIQPLQNLGVIRKHSGDVEQQRAFARHWIQTRFAAVEKLLQQTAGRYCYQGQLTMADLCLAPQVYNAARFQVDMEAFPFICRVQRNLQQLESYIQSAPECFAPEV
ncbi:MAG: maleylacetoacetate isomerase [Zetaproteobacteria bacterium]|nr:maleylacetoacetate isomerase [Zetaproteobacteria bacterium]